MSTRFESYEEVVVKNRAIMICDYCELKIPGGSIKDGWGTFTFRLEHNHFIDSHICPACVDAKKLIKEV